MGPLVALTLALVAGGAARCEAGLPAGAQRSRPPDVVVILLDACRPDRLGAYGNTRGLTPFLDTLAQHAYVFERAYAAAPYTPPSVASLFTARYPSQHGIAWFDRVLPDDAVTLAEVLHARGYATAMVKANVLFGGDAQGFDDTRFVGGVGSGNAVNQKALAWLAQVANDPNRPPVFLYLHYIDTHSPYAPPPWFAHRILEPAQPLDPASLASIIKVGNDLTVAAAIRPLSAGQQHMVTDLYDASVRAVDGELRTLFRGLRKWGVLEH